MIVSCIKHRISLVWCTHVTKFLHSLLSAPIFANLTTFYNNVRSDDLGWHHHFFLTQQFALCLWKKGNNIWSPPYAWHLFLSVNSLLREHAPHCNSHCVSLWKCMSPACAEKVAPCKKSVCQELIWGSWQVASNKHCANPLGVWRSHIWERHLVIVRAHETDWKGQFMCNRQQRLTLTGWL